MQRMIGAASEQRPLRISSRAVDEAFQNARASHSLSAKMATACGSVLVILKSTVTAIAPAPCCGVGGHFAPNSETRQAQNGATKELFFLGRRLLQICWLKR